MGSSKKTGRLYSFYKADPPAATIIFDLEDEYTENPNQVSIDWVGSTYVALEPFASLIDKLITSREPIYETAFSEDDGYLLSFAKPIFDEKLEYFSEIVANAISRRGICSRESWSKINAKSNIFILVTIFNTYSNISLMEEHTAYRFALALFIRPQSSRESNGTNI